AERVANLLMLMPRWSHSSRMRCRTAVTVSMPSTSPICVDSIPNLYRLCRLHMLPYRLYIAFEVIFMSTRTCCFTGHRPQSFPWKYNEGDLRCLLLKARLRREILRAVMADGVG